MGETFLNDVGPIIGSVVVALVGWGVAELSRWIRSRYKNERLARAVDIIGASVVATVKEAEVKIRPTLSDGKLTPEEIKQIKGTVTSNVKRRIGPAVAKVAKDNLLDLDDWIEGQTEATLYDLNRGEVIK